MQGLGEHGHRVLGGEAPRAARHASACSATSFTLGEMEMGTEGF